MIKAHLSLGQDLVNAFEKYLLQKRVWAQGSGNQQLSIGMTVRQRSPGLLHVLHGVTAGRKKVGQQDNSLRALGNTGLGSSFDARFCKVEKTGNYQREPAILQTLSQLTYLFIGLSTPTAMSDQHNAQSIVPRAHA